jgi:23S rRNA (adenine2030-N6)-methyltransferase
MFSYRHAYHAGNHADVLKHTVLIAILKHMCAKDADLCAIDTHAGAGLYRLDGAPAQTSGESLEGLLALVGRLVQGQRAPAPALRDYLDVLASFNPDDVYKVYPGSPFVMQHLMRRNDKIKLFEWHPTDARALAGHVEQLRVGRQVAVLREDGFVGLRKFLPPPSRRGLVLIDPSYEVKTDYARVSECIQDSLKRFSTGTYAVWYPIIPRMEAHDLPKRLKTLSLQSQKPWLHATLTIKSGQQASAGDALGSDGKPKRPGLAASGMFVINPPYTLNEQLKAALPDMVELMGQDGHATHTLEIGGTH